MSDDVKFCAMKSQTKSKKETFTVAQNPVKSIFFQFGQVCRGRGYDVCEERKAKQRKN